jgi:putative ABC transport system substrate-binding protein
MQSSALRAAADTARWADRHSAASRLTPEQSPRIVLLVVSLVAAFTIALVVTPLVATAQIARTYRVAVLANPTPEMPAYLQTFRASMLALGYTEGRNLSLDVRDTDPELMRVPTLVDELIAMNPDVLVGWESVAQVMRAKTTSIPIVLTGAIDPVRAGLAQSLRRPGMNVTGIAQLNDQLPAKHIEIMREILPRLARVGQLVDTTASGCKLVEEQARQAAGTFGAALVSYYVSNRDEIQRAFAEMEKERPDVLLPCPSAVLASFRNMLFENAVRLRIPLTSFVVANVPQGVLFSYAASRHEQFRRAAVYVDKILKGTNPGDLPIEQPTSFELVINLKTARTLGLRIPPSVLLRADRVIE